MENFPYDWLFQINVCEDISYFYQIMSDIAIDNNTNLFNMFINLFCINDKNLYMYFMQKNPTEKYVLNYDIYNTIIMHINSNHYNIYTTYPLYNKNYDFEMNDLMIKRNTKHSHIFTTDFDSKKSLDENAKIIWSAFHQKIGYKEIRQLPRYTASAFHSASHSASYSPQSINIPERHFGRSNNRNLDYNVINSMIIDLSGETSRDIPIDISNNSSGHTSEDTSGHTSEDTSEDTSEESSESNDAEPPQLVDIHLPPPLPPLPYLPVNEYLI